MESFDGFYGPNAAYIEELYERYLTEPTSVDPQSRAYFDQIQRASAQVGTHLGVDIATTIAATNYVQAVRTYGHLKADLNPLEYAPPGDPSLTLAFHGLSEDDLRHLPPSVVGGPLAKGTTDALEAVKKLDEIYLGTRGYEYGHIRVQEERQWLRDAAETGRFRPPSASIDERGLLDRLTQVEVFEQFIHRYFPGKTRFSIEGVDLLVPMLDEIACRAVDADICTILVGMAHRGRLNVLAHVMEKSYAQILAEFKDSRKSFIHIDQLGWTGDVKYHKGASHAMREGNEIKLIISMAPNPSHLEHINPVIEGMARASDSKTNQPGEPTIFPLAALPILIHGDAAFPGEGITAETLNISHLPGYQTGGTIHIISNNQIGYTTLPEQGRSTLYASDLAKGFEIPIMHVNADDPVACLEAARTALAYRLAFGKDFMVDLVGYRRFGHNEGDEPSFTQPELYEKIEQHPPVRNIWAESLVSSGKIEHTEPEQIWQRYMDELQKVYDQLKPEEEIPQPKFKESSNGYFKPIQSKLTVKYLTELNNALLTFPEGFEINRKLERPIDRRRSAFEKSDHPNIDWGTAEELAFATILTEGIPIRLTGQDVERGTFSHRHAVFHEAHSDNVFIPLQNFEQSRATFEVINSPLSENATIGFEFGYSIMAPRQLVVWEAQYGDFINTAQAVIDEFLVSAQAKWEQKPSLVMLLPHGYEGQGPDHSSGRPERFLQMATSGTMRVANCSTSAQYFHLLRLQAHSLAKSPLPLVIFTPKSLLRHPAVTSSPRDLAEGMWHPVLDDPQITEPDQVNRLLFCTGKIAVELMTKEDRQQHLDTAIIRIEQLLPFPEEEIQSIVGRYMNAKATAWVQEEPENMGWWNFIQPRLKKALADRLPLHYIGRAPSSSPAEGSFSWHIMNQTALLERAFQGEAQPEQEGVIIYKG